MKTIKNKVIAHAHYWADIDYNTFKQENILLDFNNYSDAEYINEHLIMSQIIDNLNEEEKELMLEIFNREFKTLYIQKIGYYKYYELLDEKDECSNIRR